MSALSLGKTQSDIPAAGEVLHPHSISRSRSKGCFGQSVKSTDCLTCLRYIYYPSIALGSIQCTFYCAGEANPLEWYTTGTPRRVDPVPLDLLFIVAAPCDSSSVFSEEKPTYRSPLGGLARLRSGNCDFFSSSALLAKSRLDRCSAFPGWLCRWPVRPLSATAARTFPCHFRRLGSHTHSRVFHLWR